MGRAHRNDKLPAEVKSKPKPKKPKSKGENQQFPMVFVDEDSDFACIKLAPGVEAKSYFKDGILFFENAEGRVIELQIINLSVTAGRTKKPRKAG